MKRPLLHYLFSILALGLAAPSDAKICWKLDIFIDVVQVTLDGGEDDIFTVTGMWDAEGISSAPLVGSYVPNALGPGFRIGLIASEVQVVDDVYQWTLDLTVDEFLRGTWVLNGDEIQFNSGELIFLPFCEVPLQAGPSILGR